jgi:uncharacterized protein YueI
MQNAYKDRGVLILQKPTVEDVLKEGMYGPKEIKPEERRQFLGTLRERIIIALKKDQVKEDQIYPQVEQQIKKFPGARLLLNGNIEYEQLSKYVTLAKKYKVNHTIVTNKDYDSEIGLVLAMDQAIDKQDIYVEKAGSSQEEAQNENKTSLLGKLFKRKEK